jgi:hypothetical protein
MIRIFSNLPFGVLSSCMYQPDVNSVSHADYTIVHSFASLHSHCESQLKKLSSSTRSTFAASTKQSFVTKFVAQSVTEDCFVAGRFAEYSQRTTLASLSQNAPRNDGVTRISESTPTWTRKFLLPHIYLISRKVFVTVHEAAKLFTHSSSKLRLLKGDLL